MTDGSRPGGEDAPGQPELPCPWRLEPLLALELLALSALTFARPILASFGNSPDTFVARGESDPVDLVLFALAVTFGPALVFAGLGLAARLAGGRVRRLVHVALVAVAGGLASARVLTEGMDGRIWLVVAGGAVGMLVVGLARWRVSSAATFLRYAGAASVAFLVQFFVASPAGTLITGDRPGVDRRAAQQVAGALGSDAPPIVFLVLDMFPTNIVLDGNGQIDAQLYPNIAELASKGTWFRNNTTMSGFTVEAVPALLSGKYPEPSESARFLVSEPDNLFTLFARSHEMNVREPLTQLCPDSLCPPTEAEGLGALFGDAVDVWTGAVDRGAGGSGTVPGLLGTDRVHDFEAWIDAQDFRPGGRPGLYFYHALLPHDPFDFLPDGSVYAAIRSPMVGIFAAGWTEAGIGVGRQRMVLQAQATDRLLGRLFDRMRAAGIYDDAMIVIAGDHGLSFEPNAPWRGVSEEQFDEVMWSLLVVKAPGQRRGVVDDRNVETVDVLPIMAEAMGFDLPWEVDGLALADNGQRDQSVKYLDDAKANGLRAPDGESHVEVDADVGFARMLAEDPVEGTGPDAVWRRTRYGGLFGRTVDDVRQGDTAGVTIEVEDLARFADIDRDEPLPIEVVGRTDGLDRGAVVAYAVDGTVAAVTVTEPLGEGGVLVHGLLAPDSLTDGANEITAYLVDGTVDDPVLHRVALMPG